jgi:hypothetical protein
MTQMVALLWPAQMQNWAMKQIKDLPRTDAKLGYGYLIKD